MKFSKSLSVVLIVVMMFSTSVFGQESNIPFKNEKVNVNILQQNITRDSIIEITEINGSYQYYEDNNTYTLTMGTLQNGDVEVYFKNKTTDNIKYDIISKSSSFFRSDYYETKFNNLRDLVLEGKINLTKNMNSYSKNIISSESVENIALSQNIILSESEADIALRIDEKLTEHYEAQHTDRLLGYLVERGETAYLFQNMHFERYKYNSWDVYAGASVNAVAAIVSWPTTVVSAVFTFASLVTGGIGLVKDVTANEYVANVHYNKEVKVANMYPYRAGKSIFGRVFLGDKDASYTYNETVEDYDFNDNTSLMQTGITNYVNTVY